MSADCTPRKLILQHSERPLSQRVELGYSGGTITSNAGVFLAALANQVIDLFRRLAACFIDMRNPALAVHTVEHDRTAHPRLPPGLRGSKRSRRVAHRSRLRRRSGVLRSAADCQPLTGKSTLNRLELAAAGEIPDKARKIVADFAAMDDLMVDLFVEHSGHSPDHMAIDIEATGFSLHGNQERRHYDGY